MFRRLIRLIKSLLSKQEYDLNQLYVETKLKQLNQERFNDDIR